MKKEEIISNVKLYLPQFKSVAENEPYQLRGIFTSEALLIISIIRAFGVNLLVESGRARGYSTKIFAEFFKDNSDFKIVSIDFDKSSEDTKYSEKQLKNYSNTSLVYGDANKILPKYITEECVVFIDGPKGDDALLLAADIIKNPYVKAVCIHDLHKNTFHRNICEIIFTDTFFSDDKDFVEEFSFLDKNCWDVLKNYKEAPYMRKGNPIDSYASTVGVILSGPKSTQERDLLNYKAHYFQENNLKLKTYLKKVLLKYPIIADTIIKTNKLFKRLFGPK
ncbi:MAG: hypothetical protein IID03_12860 [Candidatus Dadabacteria bacterium]|nr:hypothetical protein [Candidatus Dadabacteria bacterium]